MSPEILNGVTKEIKNRWDKLINQAKNPHLKINFPLKIQQKANKPRKQRNIIKHFH